MQSSALVFFVVLSASFGLLLYLPFFAWFRRRRRHGLPTAQGLYGTPLPRDTLGWAALGVATLLLSFAHSGLAPGDWLRSLVDTHVGRAVVVVAALAAANPARFVWSCWKSQRERALVERRRREHEQRRSTRPHRWLDR